METQMTVNGKRLQAAIKDAVGAAVNEPNFKQPWSGKVYRDADDISLSESSISLTCDGHPRHDFSEREIAAWDGPMVFLLRSEDSGQDIKIPVTFEAGSLTSSYSPEKTEVAS